MRRSIFNSYIKEHNFRDLFIELEWNNARGDIYIDIDETEYTFKCVAEMRSFKVITCQVDVIPPTAMCKRIDTKLRPSAQDYILIYHIPGDEHQKWVIPVRNTEKRDLVSIEYLTSQQADFLFDKLEGLNMDGISNIADVKASIQQVFAVNSEKITKDFFREFKTEHKAFLSMISGLDDNVADKDNRNKDWYTSVMLNHLMFCYFIQKKGFLDGNVNYLHDKLRWMQGVGRNQFFGSFYKGFLCSLFHDGLNSPRHQQDFKDKYGQIPYLNGGMFDEHQQEREYRDIDIKDEAFERLFNFFDKWNWHLDTRLTASGKDINPDVLGYIFEQYINDRAAMGAYYTKEDITEYIGKNCIIPFLIDKTASATKDSAKAFAPDGWVWQMLRQSGDRYIYDAVKKGYSSDWKQRIPDYIYKGIDTTQPKLLERRSRWNEKTHEEFALPTEIWRETVERLQRCDSLLSWIQGNSNLSPSGESERGLPTINDFITYNLDIRRFAEDLIRLSQDHLFVGHFYHALQGVTILDPTCGSGAFLFAALNILEPLYEACLDRMEEWHQQNRNLFKDELEEINAKYSSNRQYFIYKSIILRNLYGVDIMVEATEIAKLRLFLKMVAVVEVDKRKDNLGLDPLPDIDFNIKCGNTLVGYATEAELDKALAYGDMFANQEFKEKIDAEMQVVATAFNLFRSEQLKAYDDNASIKATKEQLRSRLTTLNDLLNRYMHKTIARGTNYDVWLKSHQPFHWLAEYYQIIKGNGGFDVIIGNPPYVDVSPKLSYSLNNYETLVGANLYGYCIERSTALVNNHGMISMIVPMSLVKMPTYTKLRALLQKKQCYYSVYSADSHPGTLFYGVQQNLTIFIRSNEIGSSYTTDFRRFYNDERANLFKCTQYAAFTIPNIVGCQLEQKIFEKVYLLPSVSKLWRRSSGNIVYYRNTSGAQFKPFFDKEPVFTLNNQQVRSATMKELHVENGDVKSLIICLYNSSLFNLWFCSLSDGRHITKRELDSITFFSCTNDDFAQMQNLAKKLMKDLNLHAIPVVYNKSTGIAKYDQFFPSKSKPIIDEIDKVLAKHYGFTEEELDFIINYDIKYRMGDELNE